MVNLKVLEGIGRELSCHQVPFTASALGDTEVSKNDMTHFRMKLPF